MISKKDLQNAAEELNTTLGLNPPIDPGMDVQDLTAEIQSVLELIDPTQDSFSDTTQAVLEELGGKDFKEAAEEEEEEVQEEAPVVVKPEKKKNPFPAKNVEKNKFGHTVGSQAATIDEVLIDTPSPMTIEEIAEKTNCTRSRIKSHLKHLMEEKGVEFVTVGDAFQLKK